MQKLSDTAIKALGSSQVISGIFSVVKELVENALDAKCDSIDVRLSTDGASRIEVQDNGPGIEASDVRFVCRQHYTNKITSHADLAHLTSYGFRGEALYSLCNVADVSITTKTSQDFVSTAYTFTSDGDVATTNPTHHNVGTIVTVNNLFKNLPVRRQIYENKKKLRDEIKQIEDLLTSYAIFHAKLRLTLKHGSNIVWRKDRMANRSLVLSTLFGNKVADSLKKMEMVEAEQMITLFMPKVDCDSSLVTRKTSDRMFVFVNGRPVKGKGFKTLLKRWFCENFCSTRYPTSVLIVDTKTDAVDVNLEPNKMKVLLTDMETVTAKVKTMLDSLYKQEGSEEADASQEIDAKITKENDKTKSLKNSLNILNEEEVEAMLSQPIHFEKCETDLRTEMSALEQQNEPRDKEFHINNSNKFHPLPSPRKTVNEQDMSNQISTEISTKTINHESVSRINISDRNNEVVEASDQIDLLPEKKPLKNVLEDITLPLKTPVKTDTLGDPETKEPNVLNTDTPELPKKMIEKWSTLESNPPISKNCVVDTDKLLNMNDQSNSVPVALDENNLTNMVTPSPTDRVTSGDESTTEKRFDLKMWSKGQALFTTPVGVLKPKTIEEKKDSAYARNKLKRKNLTVEEDVNQSKLSWSKSKSYREQTPFSFHTLSQKFRNRNTNEKSDLSVVGVLPNTCLWVVVANNKYYCVDKSKLSELLIFKKMKTSHCLEGENLQKPVHLNADVLGERLFGDLIKVPTRSIGGCFGRYLESDVLSKNGFIVRHVKSNSGKEEHLECTHAHKIHNLTTDLLQTLAQVCRKDAKDVFRTKSACAWFKEESTRMSQSHARECCREEINALVEKLFTREDFHQQLCLHQKPIVKLLCGQQKPIVKLLCGQQDR